MFTYKHNAKLDKMKEIKTHFLNEKTFKQIGNGFFAIHKSKNVTSAETLDCLKEAIMKDIHPGEIVKDEKYILKVGHGGTLDKTATGVLVIAICNGCKILSQLLNGPKSYTVTGQLGIATDTLNETGAVVTETSYDHVTQNKLEKALKEFKGEIIQTPPVYSALKKNGFRLSDLARRGDVVEVQPRRVTCYNVMCTAFDPPNFTLNVDCSKGFYIRSLVDDLGKAVGSAAHVTSLVRTKQGPFTLYESLEPEHFTLQNVVTWIRLARKQHWQFAKYLDNYYRKQSKHRQNRF